MATIDIIRRSNGAVIKTWYSCFYTKYRGKLYIWKIKGKGRMRGSKPLDSYSLKQFTWRFK